MTPREADCLDAIRTLQAQGVAPTMQEIATRMGYANKSRAFYLLEMLERDGLIRRRREGRSQEIEIVGEDLSPSRLRGMSDEALRIGVAHIAGILAHREGGYGPETCRTLENIAARLRCAPRNAA